MHTLIINLQWSSNQCRLYNWQGETTLLSCHNQLIANVWHSTWFLFLYIRVNNGNERDGYFVRVQVLYFSSSLARAIVSLISSIRNWFNCRRDCTYHVVVHWLVQNSIAIWIIAGRKVLGPFRSSSKERKERTWADAKQEPSHNYLSCLHMKKMS